MDSITQKITLGVVIVELLILTPAMIREIQELLGKRNAKRLRRAIAPMGTGYNLLISDLCKATKLKEDAVLDALYDLKDHGEVDLQNERWYKLSSPSTRRRP